MRTSLIALTGLGIILTTGCSTQSGSAINSKYGIMATASTKRVSGSDLSVCTSDGVSAVFALDDDQDGFAIEPSDWTDIYADNSSGYADYICVNLTLSGGPKHYIQISADSEIGMDCNDDATTGASINPDAAEVCDTVDNNCDGSVDESGGSTTYFADADGDTYGDASATSTACSQPSGYVTDSTDCDDTNVAVNPGATEVCDAADVDEDCDGSADDADSSVSGQSTWYLDGDGDTYGSAATSDIACDQPLGYVGDSTDCDDGNAAAFPGNPEVCDGADNDCAGGIDDGLTFDAWYADADSDTYGDPATWETTCDGAPSGFVADDTDCDDGNSGINPGAAEILDNAVDEDCDGTADMTPSSSSEICAEGVQSTDTCSLFLSDMTVYPYTPDDPTWWPYVYATGTGEVCTSAFGAVSGHSLKANLDCIDSTTGVEYWGWMSGGTVHTSVFTIGGVSVLSSTTDSEYDTDGDGVMNGGDGVVTIP